MKSSLKQIKRVGLACVALGAIAVSQQSLAAGTLAGTPITNTATVNYQVGGVSQDAINSNTASFVVDNKVNLLVERLETLAVTVNPGGANYVTAFRLSNLGNKAQGFVFNGSAAGTGDANTSDGTANPFAGPNDSFDMLATGTYVESAGPCGAGDPAPGFDAGTDTARAVSTLNPDNCVYVYILANADTMANGAVNGAVSVVTLSAEAREANTLAALTATAGADTAGEDIVFADAGNDAIEATTSAYVVSSAALTVAKSSAVVFDPINSAPNFKAIPGAIVEYTIRLTNSGNAPATGVVITDSIPSTGISFWPGQYNAGASDVSIQVGAAAPTFCVAEAGPDGNGDGCFLNGGVLTVGSPAVTQVVNGGAATELAVSFRMRITP